MVPSQTTPSGINFVRTPDERFDDVEGFPYKPNHLDVDGLRMAYLDEGPAEAPPMLLLHGEPTWSYLYRRMIPILLEAGHRIVAPDRFARIVLANTVLPDGSPMTSDFTRWLDASQSMAFMDAGRMLRQSVQARELTEGEAASYAAPFPSEEYMAGAREIPPPGSGQPRQSGATCQPGRMRGAEGVGQADPDAVGSQ